MKLKTTRHFILAIIILNFSNFQEEICQYLLASKSISKSKIYKQFEYVKAIIFKQEKGFLKIYLKVSAKIFRFWFRCVWYMNM